MTIIYVNLIHVSPKDTRQRACSTTLLVTLPWQGGDDPAMVAARLGVDFLLTGESSWYLLPECDHEVNHTLK